MSVKGAGILTKCVSGIETFSCLASSSSFHLSDKRIECGEFNKRQFEPIELIPVLQDRRGAELRHWENHGDAALEAFRSYC